MFFSPKTEGKIVLLLEVQSSLVRGSLVWLRPGTMPEILFTDSRPVPYKAHVDGAYFAKMNLRALDLSIHALAKQLYVLHKDPAYRGIPSKVAEVHFALSSPWVVSKARTLSVSFERDTRVSAEKVDSLLEAERGKLTVKEADGSEIVEEKVFDMRLNGYSLAHWQGKECRELEISYALSVADGRIIERFRGAVSGIIRPGHVHFHSSLLLQYVGLSRIMPNRETYTLVHIHGELTDIVLVKHHSCIFFGSYPFGIQTIIRKVGKAAKLDRNAAESLLSLAIGGKLEAEHGEAMRSTIDGLGQGWASGFASQFKQAGFEDKIPKQTVIMARLHEGFFIESFRKANPDSEVETLSAEMISEHVSFDKQVEHNRLVGIYSAGCDII